MRKLYHFLVVTVFLLCLVPQTCLAIMYANGDANYPIWNTGNRGKRNAGQLFEGRSQL